MIPGSLILKERDKTDRLVEFPEDFVLAVECLDGSAGFSRRLGFMAYLIARRLKLDDVECRQTLEAAYLSQLGKSAVSGSVLNPNGPLTDEETRLVQIHPKESARQ